METREAWEHGLSWIGTLERFSNACFHASALTNAHHNDVDTKSFYSIHSTFTELLLDAKSITGFGGFVSEFRKSIFSNII